MKRIQLCFLSLLFISLISAEVLAQKYDYEHWRGKAPGYHLSHENGLLLVPNYKAEGGVSNIDLVSLDDFQIVNQFEVQAILIAPFIHEGRIHALKHTMFLNDSNVLEYLIYDQDFNVVYIVNTGITDFSMYWGRDHWIIDDNITFAGLMFNEDTTQTVLIEVSEANGIIGIDTFDTFGAFESAGFLKLDTSYLVWGNTVDTIIQGSLDLLAEVDLFNKELINANSIPWIRLNEPSEHGYWSEKLQSGTITCSRFNDSIILLQGTSNNFYLDNSLYETNVVVAKLNLYNKQLEETLSFADHSINSAASLSKLTPCSNGNYAILSTEGTTVYNFPFQSVDSGIKFCAVDANLEVLSSDTFFLNDGLFQWVHSSIIVDDKVVLRASEYSQETGITTFLAVFDCEGNLLASIDLPKREKTIHIFPNPTNDLVNIVSDFEVDEIRVLNQSGQLVGLFYQNNFEIAELPNGIYSILIYHNEGIVIDKIIKN